jgi:excisionase family DNA binding protein
MENLTFEQLPQAMRLLHEKIDRLEQLLATQNTTHDRDAIFNVKEAADFLSLSVSSLYGKTCRREVPFNKKGKRLYFYKSELEEWVRQGRKKTLAEVQREAIQYKTGKRND